MHVHLNAEGFLIATALLALWTILWGLVFARALKYLLRQRLLECVLLDRLERVERGDWPRSAAGTDEAAPALSNQA